MKIGYIKESPEHQDLLLQIKTLRKSGCKKIFQDKAGCGKNQPELERMIYQLDQNDVVVIWKLDHLAKSLKDLIRLVNLFREIKVHLVSIQDHINTITTQDRQFYQIISLLAEFDKGIAMEKTVSRPASTIKRSRKGGRPKGLSSDSIMKARKAKELYENETNHVEDIAHSLGIGKTTLYRYLRYTGSDIMQNKETELIKADENEDKIRLRKELISKLIESNAFWSYSNDSYRKIPDDVLIQKVMEELDIDDIKKLFLLYNKNYIRKVWKDRMVAQDPYYRSLNILLAKLFFNINNPEKYLSNFQKEYQNSFSE